MSIISQLVQFIFQKREVKDLTFSPTAAAITIVADAIPLFMAVSVINGAGIQVGEVTISSVSYAAAVVYTAIYTALFYSFFAAQEKQERFTQAATAFFGTSILLTLANIVVAQLPGGGLFTLAIVFLKIFCSVRVMTQSLDYGVARAVFSLLGISMMAFIIASTIFPIETIQTPIPLAN